jgi:hypothetical protein
MKGENSNGFAKDRMPDWLQLQRLSRADRSVKRCRMHIQEIAERVTQLERHGLDTFRDRTLLQTWRQSEKVHEEDLASVEADIKRNNA